MTLGDGTTPRRDVLIHVDEVVVRAADGVSLAAALLDAGVVAFRRSVGGEPRAPLCGMGVCFECRITVDGVAHQRACLVRVVDGMRVSTAGSAPAEGGR
jgi:sarcosine oxidase subunit alpha